MAPNVRRGRFLEKPCSALLLSLMVWGAFVFAAAGQLVYPTPYTFKTLAGLAGNPGSTDAIGSHARFNYPFGVAVDSAGIVYVADTYNCTIRKVTQAGEVTTLAGQYEGSADGTGSGAGFDYPFGVAANSAGIVYVADTDNFTIRNVTTPAGVVTTLAGLANHYGYRDATKGSDARFSFPTGVAVDSAGIVYVADVDYNTIRKVTPDGVVTSLAGQESTIQGYANGQGSEAQFRTPLGVAVDSAGNVYVADCGNYTIRKVTAGGFVTTLAGLAGSGGQTDGKETDARFGAVSGVAVDSAGNVYVADGGSWCHVGSSLIRKVTPGGVVTTLAGMAGNIPGSADGTGSGALFYYPHGVAVDSAGNVYVADTYNHTIRKGTYCYPLVLESAPTVKGPWMVEAGAVVDQSAMTITVALLGGPNPTRFYRITSPCLIKIINTIVSGSNLVLTYQFQ